MGYSARVEDQFATLTSTPLDQMNSLNLLLAQTVYGNISNVFFGEDSLKNNLNFFFEFELKNFYKKYYQGKSARFEDAAIKASQAAMYFNVDLERLRPRRTWNVLLHLGNLEDFRSVCVGFWVENLGSDTGMDFFEMAMKIRTIPQEKLRFSNYIYMETRFLTESKPQAEMLCAYVEYVFRSRLLLPEAGSYELFHLVKLFSEQMAETISKLEILVDSIVQTSFAKKIGIDQPGAGCAYFLSEVPSLTFPQVKAICSQYDGQDEKRPQYRFLMDLYRNCGRDLTSNSFKLNDAQILHLCTDQGSSPRFVDLLQRVYADLAQIYAMDQFSPHMLALLQLTKSRLTLSSNKYLDQTEHPAGVSVNAWDPATFPNPFEMSFFNQDTDELSLLIDYMDPQTIKAVFNSNALFNESGLYTAIHKARTGDYDYFQILIALPASVFKPFWTFMVKFVRDAYFGGFYIDVTREDIARGLRPQFIRDFNDKPVLLGGTPDIDDTFHVIPPKMHSLIEKGTGAEKYSDIDQVKYINSRNYILTFINLFNGNYTFSEMIMPWKDNYKSMEGCQDICPLKNGSLPQMVPGEPSQTQSDSDSLESFFRTKRKLEWRSETETDSSCKSIDIYQMRLNRTFNFRYFNSSRRDSVSFDFFRIDQSQFRAEFPGFYQDKLHGFLNLTTVLQAPVLVSQNHQFNVQPKVANQFEYVDDQGHAIRPSVEEDGNFYEIEKISGVVTRKRMHHHFHLQIQPSLLFSGRESELAPIQVSGGEYVIAPLYNLEFVKRASEEDLRRLFHEVTSMYSFMKNFLLINLVFFILIVLVLCLFLFLLIRQRNIENSVSHEYESSEIEGRLIGHENMYMEF